MGRTPVRAVPRYVGSQVDCHGTVLGVRECECSSACRSIDPWEPTARSSLLIRTDTGSLVRLEHVRDESFTGRPL